MADIATVDRSERASGERASVVRNPTVLGISLASLLSDASHDMATAALPWLLRSLGAPAAALGAIEGIADGALSATKVAGGVVVDPGVERKTVAAGGYAVPLSATPASRWPTHGRAVA